MSRLIILWSLPKLSQVFLTSSFPPFRPACSPACPVTASSLLSADPGIVGIIGPEVRLHSPRPTCRGELSRKACHFPLRPRLFRPQCDVASPPGPALLPVDSVGDCHFLSRNIYLRARSVTAGLKCASYKQEFGPARPLLIVCSCSG